MSHMTRREWSRLSLGGLLGLAVPGAADARPPAVPLPQPRPTVAPTPKPKKIRSKFKGVQIGVQSYSFRDQSLDDAIKSMAVVGLGSCELWQGHVEPRDLRGKEKREELRRWRMNVSLDEFVKIREKFYLAGIEISAYNLSFRDDFTDAEIERGFHMARALGVKVITASGNLSVVKRVEAFAKQHGMRVGFHNHSEIRPNEFATQEDLTQALLLGAAPYIALNLDIGHFTAAGFDPVAYLGERHARIVSLHIKDRRRNQGPNVPFGEGDTPIKEVLTLLKRHRWPIPANIEYEYQGKDTLEEVRRCLEYCKKALGA